MDGAEFLEPSITMRNKMETFMNRVRRWITNCFYSTNINVLSSEVCLMPADLYLKQIRDMGTVRWATALPTNNIATAMFPPSFPLLDSYRLPTTRTKAFARAGGMKPKTWDSTSYKSVQKILPVDDIARRARLFFTKWTVPRKPNVWSPPSLEKCKYYDNTLKTIRETIYMKWKQRNYPEYYGYRLPFRTCWHFMTAGKFTVACLHQMRACKSYLRAQRDWRDPEGSPTCPRCSESEETFVHIVTECPALATPRMGFSKISFDISSESLVWKENKKDWEKMKGLLSFISLNKINFPVGKEVFPFMQATQIQS